MAGRKVIAVVGATGAQGGGLADAILSDLDSEFSVRALTRDPSSDAARALADRGAEVVAADIDDADSLTRALDGAYGAFFVTFFWAHFSAEKEGEEAERMAAAAKAAGVEHVIWSTLEDTRKWVPLDDDRMPTLQGKYKVPHFDGKGEADRFFADAGVPTTYLLTTFYWDNMIHFGMGPARGEDGSLAITFPTDGSRIAGISADDIGKVAYGIFREGPSLIGKQVAIAGEHLTGEQMAAALSQHFGEPVAFNSVTPEAYRGFGFPGADDLGNMFQFYAEFEDYFTGVRDLDEVRRLNPELKSFDDWLAANAGRIPIE